MLKAIKKKNLKEFQTYQLKNIYLQKYFAVISTRYMEESRIIVHGTTRQSFILGMVNAYLAINPKTTLNDLNRTFPVGLKSDAVNKFNHLFIKLTDLYNLEEKDRELFMAKHDEIITLYNKMNVVLQGEWQSEDFDNLVKRFRQYGIDVTDAKPSGVYEKGGFALEYTDNYIQLLKKERKKGVICIYLFLLFCLLLVLIILLVDI